MLRYGKKANCYSILRIQIRWNDGVPTYMVQEDPHGKGEWENIAIPSYEFSTCQDAADALARLVAREYQED